MNSDRRSVQNCKESVGTCVVFNCKNFPVNGSIDKTRHGTDEDGKMIRTTFSEFKFDVVTIDDPTDTGISQEMESIRLKQIDPYQEKKQFFICFILSHGKHADIIETSNSQLINLKDAVIEKLHNITHLKDTNKIIVIQSCRGDLNDEGEFDGKNKNQGIQGQKKDIKTEFEQVTPITSRQRFFLMFCTTPGYLSYRTDIGTTFVHMLCEMLKEHRSTLTLSELAQRLIFTISRIPVETEIQEEPTWCLQIPNFVSTLQSPLVLHHEPKFQGKGSTDNEITDIPADEERNQIFHKLQEIVDNGDNFHSFPVVEDRNFLLLAKQTTGSYNIDIDNGMTRQCLVIDIRSRSKRNESANDDHNVIKDTMDGLKFEFKQVEMLFDRKTKTWDIDIEKCVPVNQETCCLLCFVQHDEKLKKSGLKAIRQIIGLTKENISMLDKPKVFIFQPYKAQSSYTSDYSDVTDGNRISKEISVKLSRESDVLLVYSTAVDITKMSLTKMFCKTLMEEKDYYSVIDLLEDALHRQWKEQLEEVNPSFSSTLRKHLVLRQKPKSGDVNDNETDMPHVQALRMFKDTLSNHINNSTSRADHIQHISQADITDHRTSKLPDLRVIYDGILASSHRNLPDVRTRADGIIPPRQNSPATSWTNLQCGSFILTVGALIVILSSIKTGLGVVGHKNKHNCDHNHNLTLNDSLLCEHSTGVTTLAIDITSLITNVVITIVGLVVLIGVKRNIIVLNIILFWHILGWTKRAIPMTYRVSGFLCHTFSIISCILEIVRIMVSKSNSFYSKDETALSVCIVILFAVLWIFPIVAVHRSRKQDSCFSSCSV